MMNNADLGITTQKLVCDKFNLRVHEKAIEQFNSNYNSEYVASIVPLIENIFTVLHTVPVKCVTYEPSAVLGESLTPHNFILINGMTLSIRTNKKGDKVAPRVIGQAGIDTFNYHFNYLYEKNVENKDEIKEIIFRKIHLMLPKFLDYLFVSDYTVWLYKEVNGDYKFVIFDRDKFIDLDYEREKFTFTRNLDCWDESTTLKYNGVSIAEIQIHRNRTFKLRFIMKNLSGFIKEITNTNETVGMTAEKTICDLFHLEYPKHLRDRSSNAIQKEIQPVIIDAFKGLSEPVKHTGSDGGERGEASKSSFDFILNDGQTLSLKTNQSKICPPEVGQPGSKTCFRYFGHLTYKKTIDEITFKEMVLENVSKMMPIYIKYLFDSDILLWLYKKNGAYVFKILGKDYAEKFCWEPELFEFTKKNLDDWNESNTVKYNGVSIGEFQVHRSRSCYKFRFIMGNLLKII